MKGNLIVKNPKMKLEHNNLNSEIVLAKDNGKRS